MNAFLPANLSPLVKPPRPCALPYDLTWDNLGPILPDFDRQGRAKARAFAAYEKQGLNGGDNSCILTLRYPTQKGQLRSETIFIKQTTHPEDAEAQKYQFLASQSVPTPRLLAVIRRDQAEIIFLEFLPTIGIDFHEASEVTSLLHLVAHLNAIQEVPTIFKLPLRERGSEAGAAFDRGVQIALSDLAQNRSLRAAIDVGRWYRAYQFAEAACDSLPLAVNHGEFYFQQVGWTKNDTGRELVVFDLETMGLRPRFTDIANIIYPLASYTGRDQVELFDEYLDRLCELSQVEIGQEEARREVRLVRVVSSCQSLPWLASAGSQPDAMGLHEALSMVVDCLSEDLTVLKLE